MRFANQKKWVKWAVYGAIFLSGFVAGYVFCLQLRCGSYEENVATDRVKIKATDFVQTSNQQEASENGKEGEKKEVVSALNVGTRKYGQNCTLSFEVAGAVVAPGVYCFEEGQLLDDAIKRSGGFYKDVYAFKFVSQYFNLAQEIKDGGRVYVPYEDDVVCKNKPPAEDPSNVNKSIIVDTDKDDDKGEKVVEKDLSDHDLKQVICVSLNNASSSELQELEGVGPFTASKIIDGRPYRELTDLLNVKGIGEVTFEKLKDDICL